MGPTRQQPSFGLGSAAAMTNPTGEVVPTPLSSMLGVGSGPRADYGLFLIWPLWPCFGSLKLASVGAFTQQRWERSHVRSFIAAGYR